MAGGGFVSASGESHFEAKITFAVIISCIMAATGGLMFGYDIGISGGVTSMPSFLEKFFPEVYRKIQDHGVDSNYCKYDNQTLQLFTSSLYLAALVATMSKVLKVFVVFLDLCVVSSDVSEFSVNAQPSISLTLSSTHTPNSPMPLHTTPQPPSIVVPATSLFYCNYIPTTSRRVDGFQNQGFRGNEGGNDGAAVPVTGQQPHGGGIMGNEGVGGASVDVIVPGDTILFVGDLYWWTIDAEPKAGLSMRL
ncbi:hypothetical protein JHK82_029164 [Glycine max]|nr:hypothetical protein JHK85_029818 [Glycine max]KAG5128329.1 hypothetical protein JHK82_029164 [Glycine max]